jgi:hypothetical protein
MLLWLVSGKQPFRRRKGASGRQSASVGASSSPRSLGQRGHISRLGSRGYLHRRAMHLRDLRRASGRKRVLPWSHRSQPTRCRPNCRPTSAHCGNISDPPHAADATLIPIPFGWVPLRLFSDTMYPPQSSLRSSVNRPSGNADINAPQSAPICSRPCALAPGIAGSVSTRRRYASR